jgi:hypothetical protein
MTVGSRIASVGVVAAFLWLAEVVASFLCWGGLPFDALPNPHFDYWYLEALRLRYWTLCFSCACLVWLTIRWLKEGHADHPETGTQYSMKKSALRLLAVALAVGVEMVTSLWYQRRLPWILSFAMDASDFRLYLRDHLTGWAISVVVGMALWYLQKRWLRKLSRRATDGG